MKALCEQCGKQYQVDETKIRGTKARFKCRQCNHIIEIQKPTTNSSQLENFQDYLENMPRANAQKTATSSSQLENFQNYLENMSLEDTQKTNGEDDHPTAPEFPPNSPSISSYQNKTKIEGFSLVTKFIAIMLLVSLVPFCVVWSILYTQIRDQIKDNTENFIDQVTTDLTVNVNTWVDNNVRILSAFSTLEGITSMDPVKQRPLLKAMEKEYPWMYLIFTADLKGINIARSDDNPLETFSERQYYKDIMAGKNPTWQVLIGKSSGKPTLVLAVPIIKDGSTVGLLCNAMAINDISTRIANWKRGETGMAFMVDEKGMVIAHQDANLVSEQKVLNNHPLIREFNDGKTGTIYFENNGEAFIGNVLGTRYGWALAVQQSEAEAFDTARKTSNFVLLGFAATAIVVALIAWLLGRVIVKPIKDLTEAAEKISIGDLDTNINIRSKDELARLGNAISRMQVSIRLSLSRLRR